jgi:hypothetical protein
VSLSTALWGEGISLGLMVVAPGVMSRHSGGHIKPKWWTELCNAVDHIAVSNIRWNGSQSLPSIDTLSNQSKPDIWLVRIGRIASVEITSPPSVAQGSASD